MIGFLVSGFKKGLVKIRDNRQLAYTLFVAVIIFFAFLFAANNFLIIAKDAQERLINVRVGSIQDALSDFIPEYIERPEELSEKIRSIAEKNKTIKDFKIIILYNGEKTIVSSLYESEIGLIEEDDGFFYNFAFSDPGHSFTTEENINGERFFKTVRAITNKEGIVIGAMHTRQSLSEADQRIAKSIKGGIITLILILILIMALFFRHARIIDYAVLYRRLEQVDKMKDDFISIASHELRSPLTIIRGYADILKDSKTANDEDRKNAKNIDVHSKRLNALINDILDISKIEQGRIEFNLEKFNPEAEIAEVVESFKYNAAEKKLNLVFYPGKTADIIADRDRLKQIFINIIGNAVKYTQKGEVKVETSIDKNRLFVRVSDTGIGMSAEEQKGLFQKFYRVKSEATKDITGTGLGLWITSQLVKKMKGEISVESIKNVGTHFIVSFPVA